MYYQNYEDYMRSVLGYPIEPANTYESYDYLMSPYERSQSYSNQPGYNNEILELYPDIYRVVNPMVCKICENNTKPITRQLVDQMTDEIYMNLESQPEANTIINVKVNTQSSIEKNNRSSNESNVTSSSSSRSKSSYEKVDSRESKDSMENREDGQRRPNNNVLRDLIRILILNRLLGGPINNIPPRPRPPRPPMRPPYPRNNGLYEDYFKF